MDMNVKPNYNPYFEDFLKEKNITFSSEENKYAFYIVWTQGFNYAREIFY